ncbi:hypothetical protein IEK_05586 [Bacillus toyonensis]|uniref:hypothetical protein n=1 Tax=Bacillus toyonensis TaxID=155322 RepID=UPI00027BECCA|nr:hypothetical protein [Bacillus toyonensis]EJV42891.1 hypothetical protein IEK_05586 [Bacillus toyonensis]KAB2353652.1 hypothetical protein F8503_29890 [Bacillus toyonensis]PED97881.1 hypothetical protein CON78_24980 [Bacillus toyonensis]PHD31451.1 hypothetical protein COF48_25830 [Bacillus toyonensis]
MNHTRLYLRFGIGPGALQNLAEEIIRREYPEYKDFNHNGNVEGGDQTRPGQPDIQCKDVNGNTVHIQVTKERSKIVKDLNESIQVLEANNKLDGATCVIFINSDPDPQKIIDCQKICDDNNCTLKIFNCNSISQLLDTQYPELRSKYLFIEDTGRPTVVLDCTTWLVGNDLNAQYRLVNIGKNAATNINLTARRIKNEEEEASSICWWGTLLPNESKGWPLDTLIGSSEVLKDIKDFEKEFLLILLEYQNAELNHYNSLMKCSLSENQSIKVEILA